MQTGVAVTYVVEPVLTGLAASALTGTCSRGERLV